MDFNGKSDWEKIQKHCDNSIVLSWILMDLYFYISLHNDTQVYYKDPKTSEEFEAVSFCMVLERMHFFYSIHLVWPAIAMAMLVPMLFVTPGTY